VNIAETEGFYGMGTAYLHSSILVPSAEMSLLGKVALARLQFLFLYSLNAHDKLNKL
jgi:hypothetical protein